MAKKTPFKTCSGGSTRATKEGGGCCTPTGKKPPKASGRQKVPPYELTHPRLMEMQAAALKAVGNNVKLRTKEIFDWTGAIEHVNTTYGLNVKEPSKDDKRRQGIYGVFPFKKGFPAYEKNESLFAEAGLIKYHTKDVPLKQKKIDIFYICARGGPTEDRCRVQFCTDLSGFWDTQMTTGEVGQLKK